jgi:hypothetical protein
MDNKTTIWWWQSFRSKKSTRTAWRPRIYPKKRLAEFHLPPYIIAQDANSLSERIYFSLQIVAMIPGSRRSMISLKRYDLNLTTDLLDRFRPALSDL